MKNYFSLKRSLQNKADKGEKKRRGTKNLYKW